MQGLQELLNISETGKEELKVSATAREIAEQPRTWRGTRKIFEQHSQHLRTFLEAAGVTRLLAAFHGEAEGIILSRKYSEMKLANFWSARTALKELQVTK